MPKRSDPNRRAMKGSRTLPSVPPLTGLNGTEKSRFKIKVRRDIQDYSIDMLEDELEKLNFGLNIEDSSDRATDSIDPKKKDKQKIRLDVITEKIKQIRWQALIGKAIEIWDIVGARLTNSKGPTIQNIDDGDRSMQYSVAVILHAISLTPAFTDSDNLIIDLLLKIFDSLKDDQHEITLIPDLKPQIDLLKAALSFGADTEKWKKARDQAISLLQPILKAKKIEANSPTKFVPIRHRKNNQRKPSSSFGNQQPQDFGHEGSVLSCGDSSDASDPMATFEVPVPMTDAKTRRALQRISSLSYPDSIAAGIELTAAEKVDIQLAISMAIEGLTLEELLNFQREMQEGHEQYELTVKNETTGSLSKTELKINLKTKLFWQEKSKIITAAIARLRYLQYEKRIDELEVFRMKMPNIGAWRQHIYTVDDFNILVARFLHRFNIEITLRDSENVITEMLLRAYDYYNQYPSSLQKTVQIPLIMMNLYEAIVNYDRCVDRDMPESTEYILQEVEYAIRVFRARLTPPNRRAKLKAIKAEQSAQLTGVLDGQRIQFSEQFVTPDGNCGFTAIRATRKEVAAALRPLAINEDARAKLYQEIRELFESDSLMLDDLIALRQQRDVAINQWSALFSNLKERFSRPQEGMLVFESQSGEDQESQMQRLLVFLYSCGQSDDVAYLRVLYDTANLMEEIVKNTLKTPEVFNSYLDTLEKSDLWLGCQTALLYAQQKHINLTIWRKQSPDEADSSLIIFGSYTVPQPRDVIHIMYTDGLTHFNVLIKQDTVLTTAVKPNEAMARRVCFNKVVTAATFEKNFPPDPLMYYSGSDGVSLTSKENNLQAYQLPVKETDGVKACSILQTLQHRSFQVLLGGATSKVLICNITSTESPLPLLFYKQYGEGLLSRNIYTTLSSWDDPDNFQAKSETVYIITTHMEDLFDSAKLKKFTADVAKLFISTGVVGSSCVFVFSCDNYQSLQSRNLIDFVGHIKRTIPTDIFYVKERQDCVYEYCRADMSSEPCWTSESTDGFIERLMRHLPIKRDAAIITFDAPGLRVPLSVVLSQSELRARRLQNLLGVSADNSAREIQSLKVRFAQSHPLSLVVCGSLAYTKEFAYRSVATDLKLTDPLPGQFDQTLSKHFTYFVRQNTACVLDLERHVAITTGANAVAAINPFLYIQVIDLAALSVPDTLVELNQKIADMAAGAQITASQFKQRLRFVFTTKQAIDSVMLKTLKELTLLLQEIQEGFPSTVYVANFQYNQFRAFSYAMNGDVIAHRYSSEDHFDQLLQALIVQTAAPLTEKSVMPVATDAVVDAEGSVNMSARLARRIVVADLVGSRQAIEARDELVVKLAQTDPARKYIAPAGDDGFEYVFSSDSSPATNLYLVDLRTCRSSDLRYITPSFCLLTIDMTMLSDDIEQRIKIRLTEVANYVGVREEAVKTFIQHANIVFLVTNSSDISLNILEKISVALAKEGIFHFYTVNPVSGKVNIFSSDPITGTIHIRLGETASLGQLLERLKAQAKNFPASEVRPVVTLLSAAVADAVSESVVDDDYSPESIQRRSEDRAREDAQYLEIQIWNKVREEKLENRAKLNAAAEKMHQAMELDEYLRKQDEKGFYSTDAEDDSDEYDYDDDSDKDEDVSPQVSPRKIDFTSPAAFFGGSVNLEKLEISANVRRALEAVIKRCGCDADIVAAVTGIATKVDSESATTLFEGLSKEEVIDLCQVMMLADRSEDERCELTA